MKNITIILICGWVLSSLLGCAQPPQPPSLEVPGLQQYYQMPGNYYTAPPPRLEYWNPDNKQSGQKMNFKNIRPLYNKTQDRRISI